MNRGLLLALALCALAGCAGEDVVGSQEAALTSPLWGMEGEAFVPDGRLMDWSYAGYHAGEDPIPDVPEVASVAAHGATGDGATDDAAAFVAAIEEADAAGGGAVVVPAGRYLLRSRLLLPTGVVIRGAGRDETTLFFPQPLEALYPGERDWSFSGGFLYASGSSSLPMRATVVEPAMRGTSAIRVSSAAELSVGDWIAIIQTDTDGSLMRRLHADFVDGGADNIGDEGMRFPTRISAIEGDRVTLERALPLDLEMRWSPTVFAAEPARTEVGVERLTIEFPSTPYPGHFNEEGYNAIHFHAVWHGWVRDVTILNADYGVSLTSSLFCTVSGVILDATESRGALTGHHGLNNGHGGDNLFIDFDIRERFVHDLTNEWYAHGVVFTRGRGDDLCMDHHRAAPYSTLWTQLDVGAGDRPWASGGRGDRGPHTAAYDTLWNVAGARTLSLPAADYGPRMTFVAFDTADAIPDGADDWYLERVAPGEIEPQNLWAAMVARRLGTVPGEDAGVPGPDAGPASDGGAPGEDSGAGSDAGTGPGADAGPGGGSGDGCGCSTPGSGAAGGIWMLAMVAWLFARRRRLP